ncbi:MAG: hypothetical protein KGJ57_21215 [Sphingomonadales bacterium]|nr:hypothetical protein [Sphingomonadales bacterium]MDE2171917.1 hypothetical protein [Sphingomonadales bacterium]
MVGRLEAERDGRTWDDPAREVPRKMGAIRRRQQGQVEENKQALLRVLEDLASRRDERRNVEEMAAGVRKITGRPFSSRQLYRKPYDTMWGRAVDPTRVVGNHPSDGAAQAYERTSLNKRQLVHQILRHRELREKLLEERRAALLLESAGDGWEPLVVATQTVANGRRRRG